MDLKMICRCGHINEIQPASDSGQTRHCQKCGGVLPAHQQPPPIAVGQHVFTADRFLLHQKHLAIDEKYYLYDETGRALLFVRRPAQWQRRLLAFWLGIGVVALVVYADYLLTTQLVGKKYLPVSLVLGALIGSAAGVTVALIIMPLRHIYFYQADTRENLVLEILQLNKWPILYAHFVLCDHAGQVLAQYRRHMLVSLYRRYWDCFGPDGRLICRAMEDSVALSILRRFFGPLYGLLRTNFIFVSPADGTVVGMLNRKWTILDRYVLDLAAGSPNYLDRRVAVGLAVLLDTGERR